MAARPAPSRTAVSRERVATSARPTTPALRVIGAKGQALLRERHRARLLLVGAAALVVGALLIVAMSQTIVASQQVRIDNVQQRIATLVSDNQNLQLARAELDSPVQILEVAQHKLGMIAPSEVTYLAPVNPGPSVAAGLNRAVK